MEPGKGAESGLSKKMKSVSTDAAIVLTATANPTFSFDCVTGIPAWLNLSADPCSEALSQAIVVSSEFPAA